MRFYALLMTLRFGVPPYRVASFFLDSGSGRPRRSREETLFHAADRVVAAARSAGALLGGREPDAHAGLVVRLVPAGARVPERRAPSRLVQASGPRGIVGSNRKSGPSARPRRPQSPSGSFVKTSPGIAGVACQESSAISASSCPAPQPA